MLLLNDCVRWCWQTLYRFNLQKKDKVDRTKRFFLTIKQQHENTAQYNVLDDGDDVGDNQVCGVVWTFHTQSARLDSHRSKLSLWGVYMVVCCVYWVHGAVFSEEGAVVQSTLLHLDGSFFLHDTILVLLLCICRNVPRYKGSFFFIKT